jgi:hypothetical protein
MQFHRRACGIAFLWGSPSGFAADGWLECVFPRIERDFRAEGWSVKCQASCYTAILSNASRAISGGVANGMEP